MCAHACSTRVPLPFPCSGTALPGSPDPAARLDWRVSPVQASH
jgi:hypothetical protein